MPDSGGTQFIKPQEIIDSLNIIQGMKVADLGCGNLGYFVMPISKIVGKDGLVYAVDILKPVLDGVESRAKLEGLTNIETVWSNLEKYGATKIPEASLDIALIINVLFQNKNYQDILKEAARLIKPGGKLLVVDWKKSGVPFGPQVDIRVDAETIKQAAALVKLKLVEETELGNYFWCLILEK